MFRLVRGNCGKNGDRDTLKVKKSLPSNNVSSGARKLRKIRVLYTGAYCIYFSPQIFRFLRILNESVLISGAS